MFSILCMQIFKYRLNDGLCNHFYTFSVTIVMGHRSIPTIRGDRLSVSNHKKNKFDTN